MQHPSRERVAILVEKGFEQVEPISPIERMHKEEIAETITPLQSKCVKGGERKRRIDRKVVAACSLATVHSPESLAAVNNWMVEEFAEGAHGPRTSV